MKYKSIMFNLILATLLLLSTNHVFAFNDTANNVIINEETLIDDLKMSNKTYLNVEDKTISKVSNKTKQSIVTLPDTPDSYIDSYDIYLIEDNKSIGSTEEVTIVTDLKLSEEGINALELRSSDGGGTVYNQKDFGRIKAYVKVSYQQKNLQGFDARRVTSIQGKIPYIQSGITIKSFKMFYGSLGSYVTENGGRGLSRGNKLYFNMPLKNLSSLQTRYISTDKWFTDNGASSLNGGVEIEYKGRNSTTIKCEVFAQVLGFALPMNDWTVS